MMMVVAWFFKKVTGRLATISWLPLKLCRRPIKAADTYIAFEAYEVGALEARAGIPVVHLRIDRPAIPDEVVDYRIFGPVGDGSKVIHGYGRYDNYHDDSGDQLD